MALYSPYRGREPADAHVRAHRGRPVRAGAGLTRIIRDLSENQAVERPATLEDVRAEVLTPERLNAFVVSGFAGIALLIAVVGVAGVLAFSVSARTREFGVRLAIGSTPRSLLIGVLSEGAAIVAVGIAAGVAGGYAVHGHRRQLRGRCPLPGALPLVVAAPCSVPRPWSRRCCRQRGPRGWTCCRPCARSRSPDSSINRIARSSVVRSITRSLDRDHGLPASLIFAIASSMVNVFGFWTGGNSLKVAANFAAHACAA